MYKDILQKLNNDRVVDSKFIERLEKNGFQIFYGEFSYWQGQQYVEVGKEKIWLVETYNAPNYGTGLCNRYRNEVVEEIKLALNSEELRLENELKLINEILPIQ
ncbi:MAG: hypothetical protein ACRCX8_07285 [Sarcina sp.]